MGFLYSQQYLQLLTSFVLCLITCVRILDIVTFIPVHRQDIFESFHHEQGDEATKEQRVSESERILEKKNFIKQRGQ